MKRPSRLMPDTDIRGRVRRTQREMPKLTKVRLQGGPFGAGGLDLDVDLRDADYLNYGGWRWSWAGKKTPEGRRIFCKLPTERLLRRLLFHTIGTTGRDPRLQERLVPFKHTVETRPVKQGHGARKRRHYTPSRREQ